MPPDTGSIAPPFIVLDGLFALDRHRPHDAHAHRRFAIEPDAARFLGWTVAQAKSQPDSHYDAVVDRFAREWEDGTRFSLVIRRRFDGEGVGPVELRPKGDRADVSYLVAAEFRGQGLAPRALDAMLDWAARELGLQRAEIRCHIDNTASERVAEKCGFEFVERRGDELLFHRQIGWPAPTSPAPPDEAD